MAALRELVDILDAHYPPHLAESWDSVGLVCGDPGDTVTAVLVCVDVTDAVVDEAIATGVELIVAHHPLLLRGVDSVGAHTPKGRLIHRMIRSGCGLFTAHTNADIARPGVSDALAEALGVGDLRPLSPVPDAPLDSWVVMVPCESTDAVAEAMFAAGAGEIGDYSRCRWTVAGTGRFLPGDAATPAIGSRGVEASVAEDRMQMVAARSRRAAVEAALRAAHPYEEPAFDLVELAATDSARGLGRVGSLAEPMSLRAFTDHVAAALRTAPWGVRAAGDPDALISTVAVCGGAGDSLIDNAAAAGADVYVTADLRHHPADEHLRAGGPALVDAGHWATEFPWCDQAAALLREHDRSLVVTVFDRPTDPFTLHGATGDVHVDR